MKAEIRGQRFEVPPAADDETTQACVRRVADYYAQAEAAATVVNTQVFALQVAYRLAKEAHEAELAHRREIALLKAAHQRERNDAANSQKDLESNIVDALRDLSHSLRALLNEFDDPPPAILRFPSREEA